MKKTSFLVFFATILLLAHFVYAQTTPVDGVCGSAHGQVLDSFPTNPQDATVLCAQGEFDDRHRADINNTTPTATQTLYWTCKGKNGGLDASCRAQGSANYYNNSLATATLPGSGCGLSNGAAFMTTQELIGIAYSNYQNAFLGNLCRKQLPDGTVKSVGPVWFNRSALGRTWQCPTESGRTTCYASLYQHAYCGQAANTGHTQTPTTQLCAPGTIQGIISFDPDTFLWHRTCYGNGGANVAHCSAWLAGDLATIEPSCNPLAIQQPGPGFSSPYITAFPGINACSVGTLSYWFVTQETAQGTTSYKATWKCKVGEKETSVCGGVLFPTYSGTKATECNPLVNEKTFDTPKQLFEQGLCKDLKVPSYFQDLGTTWTWSCGSQTCQAYKSKQTNCGRAVHVPTRLYPTQGLCKTGLVATMLDTVQTGYRWERTCHPVRNPNDKTYCKAPRIVDGACKWQTLINTTGYSTPQEVLDAGMCASGIPSPLVPVMNTTAKKRTRTCNGRGGNPSQTCMAKVYLPRFPVVFNKPKPASGTILGPVIAELTGFNPLYVSFVNPLNQRFKLFTTNTGFTFIYKDRADNVQQVFVRVDWIDTSLPSAIPVYTPSGYTSGNVVVKLTGFTNTNLLSLTFSGTCLTQNTCKSITSINDITYTNVIFSGNGEGYFRLVDEKGENIIPIVVTGIDRVPPQATLSYSTMYPTKDPVFVEVINPTEPITIDLPTQGTYVGSGIFVQSGGLVFTRNGSYSIKIIDRAGNSSYLTATVTWIDTNAPSATVFYSTTGLTNGNVVATLGNFTKTGVRVVNNNGLPYYTFTYNSEFTFILEDAVGNRGSVTAKVDWIDKPILADMIAKYQQNICHRLKQKLPVDAMGNEYSFHITTVIRNCLMKGFVQPNGSTYFYPRKPLTRGEFITILGRYIKLIAEYEGNAVNDLSPYLIGVSSTGKLGPEISEADARGLFLYTPLYQSGTQKYINITGTVPSKEAKAMLRHVFTHILNLDPKPLDFLISNDGILTRGEAAYIFGSLIQDYERTAMGNHLEFYKALQYATQDFTPAERRKFITQILAKLTKIDDATLWRVGLNPAQLRADLVAIAQNSLPKKKKRPYIHVKTVMDRYLRGFDDPHDNTYRNMQHVYTEKMYEPDGKYESWQTIWKR